MASRLLRTIKAPQRTHERKTRATATAVARGDAGGCGAQQAIGPCYGQGGGYSSLQMMKCVLLPICQNAHISPERQPHSFPNALANALSGGVVLPASSSVVSRFRTACDAVFLGSLAILIMFALPMGFASSPVTHGFLKVLLSVLCGHWWRVPPAWDSHAQGSRHVGPCG